jgi:hypothetical protein
MARNRAELFKDMIEQLRFDIATGKLDRLGQRYARRSPATYWYEAPRFDYAALLELDAHGFAIRYPGLWEAEHALDDPRR